MTKTQIIYRIQEKAIKLANSIERINSFGDEEDSYDRYLSTKYANDLAYSIVFWIPLKQAVKYYCSLVEEYKSVLI